MTYKYSILTALFAILASAPALAKTQKVTLAGGCFWCMEPPFEKLDGVSSVVSGFMGGEKVNPSYKAVAGGKTKHREVVEITYDDSKVKFEDLMQVFWRQINPTDAGGQFVDRGFQYSTAVYYTTPEQKRIAEKSKVDLAKLKIKGKKVFTEKIITPILPAKAFYAAEDYHQDFYKKSSLRYKYYRYNSGRDQYLDKTWGKARYYKVKPQTAKPKAMSWLSLVLPTAQATSVAPKKKQKWTKPSPEEIKKRLTPEQWRITQEDGTERAFKNKYWDNKKPGIYVDIVTGEPLFSSKDKYKSGTGWPSFTKPLVKKYIVTQTDFKIGWPRTEVRSKIGDSHLGHVFKDGPKPTGLRYCMNSAALRFIPAEKLVAEGYGEFAYLFK